MEIGYIIHWHTKEVNGFAARGGYCIIEAADKTAARQALRQNLGINRGEKLCIESMSLVSEVLEMNRTR